MNGFGFNEKDLSQIPALQELIILGYEYLSPKKALAMRGGKTSNVLLEDILREQLSKLNRIHYKGNEYHFSEANIQEAIQKLKNVNGLEKTNEAIYNLITLPIALRQTVEGNPGSFDLNYIDWKNPANNVFHVVAEYVVEGSRSTAIPDIVLFVNGIPLAVIECKNSSVEIEQAISQNIRNQGNEYIPRLFTYVQLIMGVNKNVAKYATAGTPAEFWAVWNELEDKEDKIASVINRPLNSDQKAELFSGEFVKARERFDTLEKEGREVTEQDKAIYSLCRPERLLELTYRFILFEGKGIGNKKIARWQQFFVIHSTMSRIKCHDKDGKRTGGMIWQTQGSGKSLTMVMLTRAVVLDIINPRIILVTDRIDLDKQLGDTFKACDLSKERATSGRNLVKHLKNKVGIITTLIHKFDKALSSEKFIDDSSDIFVLVDESHRTNFGFLEARMRKMLPNSCYLGFTGTPLLKKEKNSFSKFGGLIEPHYSIKQAVKDKAVLPLLYERRHVEIRQNKSAIDLWFERHTSDLTKEQQADLKKKYARPKMLNESDQVIYMRAFDISEHYRTTWRGTGLKAQLVAPSKATALKYHEHLKEIGSVTSEVIISAPDTREGHEEIDEVQTDKVSKFWGKMMKRFGSEEEYTKQIIKWFKDCKKPEILIVVDKLLTGFNAPRNTVLYLCRTLREHNLLQAIARVNRLHKNKDYGYIVDYASVLGELNKALTMYEAFKGFDEEDLAGTLTSINEKVQMLPQLRKSLLDVFREIKNKHDEEDFERLLADDELREDFYERLSEYSKTLGIALSTDKFIMETDEAKLRTYKGDLKRFQNLKTSVKLRYADANDYRDYDPKIKKLLDTHIHADEVIQLNEPVDDQNFDTIKQGQGIYSEKSTAAKADIIAYATKKVIHDKMGEDPAFYEKFSKLIQQAIDDFKARRISDLDYLNKVSDIGNKVVLKHHDDVPNSISGNDKACAYYGVILPYFRKHEAEEQIKAISVKTSLAIQHIINKHWKIDFWTDYDSQNNAKNDIDNFLCDEIKGINDMDLSDEQIKKIIEKTMEIAKNRRHE